MARQSFLIFSFLAHHRIFYRRWFEMSRGPDLDKHISTIGGVFDEELFRLLRERRNRANVSEATAVETAREELIEAATRLIANVDGVASGLLSQYVDVARRCNSIFDSNELEALATNLLTSTFAEMLDWEDRETPNMLSAFCEGLRDWPARLLLCMINEFLPRLSKSFDRPVVKRDLVEAGSRLAVRLRRWGHDGHANDLLRFVGRAQRTHVVSLRGSLNLLAADLRRTLEHPTFLAQSLTSFRARWSLLERIEICDEFDHVVQVIGGSEMEPAAQHVALSPPITKGELGLALGISRNTLTPKLIDVQAQRQPGKYRVLAASRLSRIVQVALEDLPDAVRDNLFRAKPHR